MTSTKQIFEAMLFDEQRLKRPNVPPHALVIKKYKLKTANGLAGAVAHYIKLLGGHAERRSNTGRYLQPTTYTNVFGKKHQLTDGKYIPGTGRKGTSDVSGIFKGVPLSIEIKMGNDKQSGAQIIYQKDVESAGGFYLIAKTFQQFYYEFNKRFIN